MKPGCSEFNSTVLQFAPVEATLKELGVLYVSRCLLEIPVGAHLHLHPFENLSQAFTF